MPKPIRIIGAGLAGSEAAWQCARRGVAVELFEMRPVRSTPAHQTANFAELVCSNSLKSDTENTAPWLLKEEMRRAGSLLMDIARQTAVPAGHALAVDRDKFAAGSDGGHRTRAAHPRCARRSHGHRRAGRDHDRRHRPADLRRAVARNPAPERQRATVFLRLHQPHRRGRFHRHVARVHGRALRQGHRRLHQLPDDDARSTTASSTRCWKRIRWTPRIGRT